MSNSNTWSCSAAIFVSSAVFVLLLFGFLTVRCTCSSAGFLRKNAAMLGCWCSLGHRVSDNSAVGNWKRCCGRPVGVRRTVDCCRNLAKSSAVRMSWNGCVLGMTDEVVSWDTLLGRSSMDWFAGVGSDMPGGCVVGLLEFDEMGALEFVLVGVCWLLGPVNSMLVDGSSMMFCLVSGVLFFREVVACCFVEFDDCMSSMGLIS